MGKKQAGQGKRGQTEDGFKGQGEKPVDPKFVPKVRSRKGGVKYLGDWKPPKSIREDE